MHALAGELQSAQVEIAGERKRRYESEGRLDAAEARSAAEITQRVELAESQLATTQATNEAKVGRHPLTGTALAPWPR